MTTVLTGGPVWRNELMEMLHGQIPPKNCYIVSAQGTPPLVTAGWGSAGFAAFAPLSFYGDLTLQLSKALVLLETLSES